MTLIMKESARSGDALAVDIRNMDIRPVKSPNDVFVGFAAKDLRSGEYAEIIHNETSKHNLKWAWLKYGGKL